MPFQWPVNWILCALVAYLLGSVSGAITVSRLFYKTDIRSYGSGNAGATNTLRTLGLKAALMCAVIDALKTIAAMTLGFWLAGETALVIAGAGVVLGHAFPVYHKFRGGKCALCGCVLAAYIDWRVFAICVGTFVLVLLTSKLVAPASMLGAFAAVPSSAYIRGGRPIVVFTAALAVFMVYLHRSNIRRIIDKTEPKLGDKENKS